MSSGFITEAEATEARRKRQEEWEKVRNPDEPEELPEEPYDSRSLFDRLKEQKDKRDLEFDEAHKLKNMIRGLDDDEIDFLDLVDRSKMNAEKKQILEDRKELEEFRERVATLQETSMDQKIAAEIAPAKPKSSKISSSRPSQKSILAGAVVQKRKLNDTDDQATVAVAADKKPKVEETQSKRVSRVTTANIPVQGALRCVGILPGIGPYGDSSDSESSSHSDDIDDCTSLEMYCKSMGKGKKKECGS